jgi:TorA maturation chaperone TorD
MEIDKGKNLNNLLKGYNMLLYFAGSMIMYEPTEECVVDFWKNGILKRLPVSSANPRFLKAILQLRDSCLDEGTCLSILREDYNRLFTVPGLALAPPFESTYLNYSGIPGNDFVGIREFYESYGWVSKYRGKIPDDHLGVELLFLTRLVEKFITLDDNACRGEMGNEIIRFVEQHLLSWIPEWNVQIQESAGTFGYKGIGTLIFACVEDIKSLLESERTRDFSENVLRN